MDIYPEDFDPAYRTRIRQLQKALGLQDGTVIIGRNYYYGFLGASVGTIFDLWLHIASDSFFLAVGAGAAIGYVCGFFVDRHKCSSRPINKVTIREINLIQQGETDALRLEYFGLVSKLITMQYSLDRSAEESIRCALRDIGSGIEKLPVQPADDLLLDAETFQREASRLVVEAAQESDPIVAASLQRQSVAQSQRGDAVSRNSALARRNQVLRREMKEHIRSLTTMLSATVLDDSSQSYNFIELAANIQQVAVEAKSLTEAKKELVSALTYEPDGKEMLVSETAQLHGH